MASTTADVLAARYGSSYRWLLTLTAMLGNISLILSSTIVNVAIPNIMGAFGVGQDKAQWLSAGFLASMTVAMLLNSWMIAAIGKRNTYYVSMAVFVVGSVMAIISTSFDMLVFARLLQGAGAGFIHPLALQVIYQIFPPDQRGRAMGFFGFGIVLAPALGPAFGGILVDAFDWRAVFWLVLPFCGIGSIMAAIFMPPRETDVTPPTMDWTGLVLVSIVMFSLLSGLSNGSREGWGSDTIIIYFAVAAVSLIGFIAWESFTAEPMLNLKLFSNLRFASGCVLSFIWGAGNFGLWYLIPLFVQIVMGFTPTKAGFLLMPAGLLLALVFPLTGRISDWISPRIPIVIGLTMTSFSCFLMAGADTNTAFWVFVWWLIIGRVGLGCVFPPLTTGSMRALPPEQVSQGAGMMSFSRQLGGAFGVSLLATFVDLRTVHYAESYIATQTSGNSATMEYLRTLQTYLGQAGTPEALQMPAALQQLGNAIFSQATMLGFREGFLISALVFFAAIIPGSFLVKRKTD
ncbi:MAG: MFS transporter [Rhodospirillaceae bacterium]|nr:MFS transporter [Rhodospirillaceae bacterium]